MKTSNTSSMEGASDPSPSALITTHIATLSDWRGEVLARVRGLINEADPGVVEAVKWRKPSSPGGLPVGSRTFVFIANAN